MWRRILGVVFLLIGIFGLVISIAGLMVGWRIVDDIGNGFDLFFAHATANLDTVYDTLLLTESTFNQIEQSLATISVAAEDLGYSLTDTQPLLNQVSNVAAVEVPLSLEAIQTAIPDVAIAAGAIDDTLTILDKFEINRRILGVSIQFDLGVDYDPLNPLDETVRRLGRSLDGLPETLRAMEKDIQNANTNLGLISENVHSVAKDLDDVKNEISEVDPLLKDYVRLTIESGDYLRQLKSNLNQKMETVRLMVSLLFAWIGFNQIVPLYLGYMFFQEGDAR